MGEENLINGDYFTVEKWKHTQDRSYIGDIFRVLRTDGSLIHCKRFRSGFAESKLMVLDRNNVDVRRVSNEFATCVINECECCKCKCCGSM